MTLHNPDDFRNRKDIIIRYFKKNGVTSGNISEYCSLCMIPITVVCTFIIEDMPEHSELCQEKIKAIEDFYGE